MLASSIGAFDAYASIPHRHDRDNAIASNSHKVSLPKAVENLNNSPTSTFYELFVE
ncbi:MAG: hypothetical protein ACLTYW_02995 [Collinsella sp.]